MAVRESRNAIKIEGWRVSQVPIDPTETILQGDLLAWDNLRFRATKLVSGATANAFLGVSDTKNPVDHIGVLTSDFTRSFINVVQTGLVEMIEDTAETVKPFDTLTVGADSQSVHKSASNVIGVVDVAYGAAGRLMAAGDYIKLWLRPSSTYITRQ